MTKPLKFKKQTFLKKILTTIFLGRKNIQMDLSQKRVRFYPLHLTKTSK